MPHWNVSPHHEHLDIQSLWKGGIVGQGVTVAVLDTGLAAPRGLDRSDFEYLDDSGQPIGAADVSGHGTAAGSVIASYLGRALGIAPHAKLVSIQITGVAGANLESAFDYLLRQRADVDVVSCSFVIPRASAVLREQVRQLSRPIAGARSGAWIDVAAPGFDLPVVLPGTTQIGRFGMSSAAAAVVSGVAALVLSTIPDIATRRSFARGLDRLFRSTASPLRDAARLAGAGLVNPQSLVKAAKAFA
jgi:subtilisin family serine protease